MESRVRENLTHGSERGRRKHAHEVVRRRPTLQGVRYDRHWRVEGCGTPAVRDTFVCPGIEDFAGPEVTLRVKVNLRTLAIDFFDYADWR